MWDYLRARTSNRSRGSRSTSISLGSSITRLSLGTRLTISTLKMERKRTHQHMPVYISSDFSVFFITTSYIYLLLPFLYSLFIHSVFLCLIVGLCLPSVVVFMCINHRRHTILLYYCEMTIKPLKLIKNNIIIVIIICRKISVLV